MVSSRAKHMYNHIVNSFILLLKNKAFTDITVKQICDKCEISRGTFYRYFQDKYDLIQAFMQKMSEEIESEAKSKNYPGKLKATINCFDNHTSELRNLLLGRVDFDVHVMMHRIYSRNIRSDMEKKFGGKMKHGIPTYLISDFFSSGIATLLLHRIMGDYTISKEQLSNYLAILAEINGIADEMHDETG